MQITSATDYESAAAELARVKGHWNAVEQDRVDLKAPLLEGGRRVDGFFAPALSFLAKAEAIIKAKLSAWDDLQETLRKKEQEKADAEATKQRARLEQRADKAAASGKAEKAELLHQEATMIVPTVIAADTRKVSGLTQRQAWDFDIVNPKAVPREYCTPDVAMIRRQVNATGGDTKIPGVRVTPKRVYGSKSAA
jgi:hypothetical protein